jgi:hypothetical protein
MIVVQDFTYGYGLEKPSQPTVSFSRSWRLLSDVALEILILASSAVAMADALVVVTRKVRPREA